MTKLIRPGGRRGSKALSLTSVACAMLAGCAPAPRRDLPAPAAAPPAAAAQVAERLDHWEIPGVPQRWRISFTPDGSTAYFAASEGFFPATRQATIYVTHLRGDGWTAPEVAPFSGTYSDIDPFVTPDGQRLYFSSIRPVAGSERDDIDIWVMERDGDGWGAPVRLGPEVNTTSDELYPSASRDGTLYFATGPRAPAAGRHWDIFRAARQGTGFAQSVRLGPEVNTVPDDGAAGLQAGWEFNPEISADGRTLIFTSLRPGAGLGDLYVSHRSGGRWSPARSLGPLVNTAADEYHPTLSPDGEWLWFVRRQAGRGEFHRIAAAALPALSPPSPRAMTSLIEVLEAAGGAQQAGDFDEMRMLLRRAQELAPDNSNVLYFLAREEARAGNLEESLDALELLAVQGTARDIRNDSAFTRLTSGASLERFRRIEERLRSNAEPLVRSDTAFVLDDPDFIPEGIAYDPLDDVFYVGALHRRSVLRVNRAGVQREFITPARDGLGQVLGMRVDAARRVLWLAALALDSTAPRHSSGVRGWASLRAYDLRDARLLETIAAPDSSIPHLLNDLVITRDGGIYITDTEAHALYRLAPGGRALDRMPVNPDLFHYPNGIALDSSGRLLYVAHYEGISVTEVGDSPAPLRLMARPPGVSGGNIDGLYACRGRLVAVQGLSGFQQVTAFELSNDGRAITGASALERRHPIHDWATTGAFVEGDFYYLANAQLRRLAAGGALSPPQKPGRSVVMRVRGACR